MSVFLYMRKAASWSVGTCWQRCAMATVNAQSTLSQRYSQRYSQRSLMYTKTYHFAQTSYFFLKNNNIKWF
jgi:hypothetical protein